MLLNFTPLFRRLTDWEGINNRNEPEDLPDFLFYHSFRGKKHRGFKVIKSHHFILNTARDVFVNGPGGLWFLFLLNHKFLKMKLKIFIWVLFVSTAFVLRAEEADTLRMQNIDEVVVKATRMNRKLKNVPQKIEIITSEDIKTLPSQNLSELLKRTSNIDIIQYPGLSATIGMRGFSPSAHSRSYTLILINGKPSGTRNISTIDLSNVERIEVVKGPNATLYGSDAMGGVINIITKVRKGTPGGTVSLESGSFGNRAFKGNVGGSLNDKVVFGLGFSRMEQQKNYRIGSKNLLNIGRLGEAILDKASYGDAMRNSSYELSNVNGQIGFAFNKKWNINTELIYTYANDIENHGNYWGSYGQSKKDINRLNWYTSLEYKNANHNFSFNPYYTNERDPNYSDNSKDGFVSFESKIQEYGFQLQDNFTFGNFTGLAGIDRGVYDYQSERFSAKGTPTVPYKPNNKNSNTGIFTNIAYSVAKLDVNAGLRYDYFKYQIEANDSINAPEANEKYTTLNPSVGVQYRITNNLKAHGSFGTAFSVPDAYKVAGKYDVSIYFPDWDYWWTQSFEGNPALKPEKSNTVDFGIKYMSPSKGLTIDVTYFSTNHTDKIVEETLDSGVKSFVNADKSKMNGLEWNISFDLGSFADNSYNLELYSNFTNMFKNEMELNVKQDDESEKLETKDLLYVRKANGNFGIYFNNLKGFSTRINARYIGSRLEKDNFTKLRPTITENDYYTEGDYEASDKILKHPSYLLFDYSVAYKFENNMQLSILFSNLLDENFSEKDGYNMQGRSVSAKISYSF